jgi:hypothetical protein
MRSMAAADFSSNYSGRVLQRNAFRSLVGRRRVPGSAISSILSSARTLPPRPDPVPPALADTADAADATEAPEQAA